MRTGGRRSAVGPVPYQNDVAAKYAVYTFDADSDDDDKIHETISGMYADEASLYSIAEDSREDAMSIVVGRSEEGVLMSKSAAVQGRGQQNPGELGIELSIEEEDEAGKDCDDNGSATQIYDLDRRARRRFMGTTACLICLMLVVLAVTLSVTQTQQQKTSKSAAVDGINGDVPTATATPTTPVEDTEDTTLVQAETLVALAIKDCPGPDLYFDDGSPQGQVFQAIVGEVASKASIDSSTGDVSFNELHGIDYLQEKFALGMLYFTTGGHDGTWKVDDMWMTDTDPCDGWKGVVCEAPRSGGTCAVTGLELGKFTAALIAVVSFRFA